MRVTHVFLSSGLALAVAAIGCGSDDPGADCTPSAEICDGIDNDCDGTIDNEPQASQACEDQDPCTSNVCQAGECTTFPSGTCDRWIMTSDTAPPNGRYLHTAVWTGEQMIVWGGNGGDDVEIYEDGYSFDPETNAWTRLPNPPDRFFRHQHTAVWTGEEMIVWGGHNEGGMQSMMYEPTGRRYRPSSNTWRSTAAATALGGRTYHTAVWTGDEMIVWGGKSDQYTCTNSGAVYDLAEDSWRLTSTEGAPAARAWHTAVWTGEKMIIWGGQAIYDDIEGGAIYDPATDAWSAISTRNAPPLGKDSTAVWTGDKMIVWGGGLSNEGGVYDPSTDTWTLTTTEGAPSGRSGHVAVWTGIEMLIWGADEREDIAKTGGGYNPQTNTWRELSVDAAPEGRGYASAVWTGGEMIVWGGWKQALNGVDFEFVNTGGMYTP